MVCSDEAERIGQRGRWGYATRRLTREVEHLIRRGDRVARQRFNNEAYGEFFEDASPARSAVGAGDVPKGAAVEIEAIATAD